MDRIEKSIDVHVPVSVAYNQWTQFEQFPEFMEGVREVRQKDDRHVHWVAEIGGRHKEWDSEITEQIPDRRIAWHSVGGTRSDGVVEFTPVSQDDTRITMQMDYDPEGLVENVADFFGVTSSRVEGDLQRFKSFIESRGRETGAWRGEIPEGRLTEGASSSGAAVKPSSALGGGATGAGMPANEEEIGVGPVSGDGTPNDSARRR
jgi:uncharacterized membrane protein